MMDRLPNSIQREICIVRFGAGDVQTIPDGCMSITTATCGDRRSGAAARAPSFKLSPQGQGLDGDPWQARIPHPVRTFNAEEMCRNPWRVFVSTHGVTPSAVEVLNKAAHRRMGQARSGPGISPSACAGDGFAAAVRREARIEFFDQKSSSPSGSSLGARAAL